MPEHEPLPKVEDYEAKPHDHEHRPHDHLEQEIRGAIDAAGKDEVVEAMTQVATGRADPEALLAWFEELREPETHEVVEIKQTGMAPDFIADTEIATGDTDFPPVAAADPVPVAETPAPDEDNDAYMFSAVRRRRLEEEDPEDPADPPADNNADKAKPKAKKR